MTTWVLLRGLTRESRHWGRFPEIFGAAMPDARILPLDLPGNGDLNRATTPSSVEAMAEDARYQLARRGEAPPWRVLAMSLGAMAAVAWASRHPAELEACVLINTSLRPFSPFYRRLQPCSYPILMRLAVEDAARRREQLVLRLTSTREPAGVLADWTRYREERPVSARNALRQLLAAATYRAPRVAPSVPMLLLAGARDRLVSPSASADIARHWGCPLRVHPDAGHDLPLDDPHWVARQVRDWLARDQALDEIPYA